MRDQSSEQWKAWSEACAAFHFAYDKLVFPGGGIAINKITAGDAEAMEAGLCWIEVRPYFFRSGYHFGTILKKLKRAPLTVEQKQRLNEVIERQDYWRRTTPERAEQGDVKAQVRLAHMHSKGQLVKYDPQAAFEWFRKAAEQGHRDAQVALCFRYENGYGVAKDELEAFFWASVVSSSSRAGSYITEIRDSLATKLTDEQKNVVNRRVAEWKPTSTIQTEKSL